ncbi:MAG TPA: pyridoxal phosphate-dependent aminotransferase [Gemmatimonadales bacterium]|nr:pyridoxal phosphate-dependent aminotransferase [Gemmatimonadales bacterium]
MNALFSRNVAALSPSATLAVSAEAARLRREGVNVVDLGAGEPDFPTPKLVAEAGIRATQQGKTKYAANEGILELRAAVARRLSLLSGGRPVNADNIVVSNGAKQSVMNACFCLFGGREKVLVPSPAWTSYPQIVHVARAVPVEVAGDPEWSLKVSVSDLDREWDESVKGLIVNSPGNPTGAVYTLAELKAIAEWAKRKGVWIVADEIYRRIHYGDGVAPSFLDLADDLLERVVLVDGASKAYAMTGWRIGIALAPRELSRTMAALQSHTTSGANTMAQWAAAEAFGNDLVQPEVEAMTAAFRLRRDYLVARFRKELPGVEFVEPMGAFYLFFRVDDVFSRAVPHATEFCRRLIADEALALVPGAAFGDDRWVRLSYAASDESLKEGVDRLVRQFARLTSEKGEVSEQKAG